jgi:hypothetical protein
MAAAPVVTVTALATVQVDDTQMHENPMDSEGVRRASQAVVRCRRVV